MSNTNELEINELKEFETPAWDEFVSANEPGSIFHLAAWQEIIGKSCGFTPYYLTAHHDGNIAGVLPLFHVQSWVFGNTLTSIPFCVSAGPIGTPDAILALAESAERLGERLKVSSLELRNKNAIMDGWITNDLYATFGREIFPDPDENMKAIPRKQRAMVRKGIKAGLESRIEESLDNFFHIYSTSVRNLGTPVFPKRYFSKLQEILGSACQITTVFSGGQPVSSVMSFIHNGTISPYYGGGLPIARTLKAYDFLYWEVMRRACESGLLYFDFGRSKHGAGSFSFKKNWGFEPQPLHYQYKLVNGSSIPNRNPMSKKYRAAVAVWKKLPLPVANAVGPLISPYLA